MIELLTVYNIAGVELSRYGWDYDGGYLVANIGGYDCILCCGIGTDVSFEQDIAKQFPNTHLHLFDNSIDILPKEVPGAVFHKEIIDGSNILQSHLIYNRDLFIKMDIEGSETEWVKSLTNSELLHIKQLVIEIHGIARNADLLKRLNETMILVHAHPNNYGGVEMVDSVPVPAALELTYVRRVAGQDIKPNDRPLPLPIDMINNPYKPDLNINFKPFYNET